MFYYGLFILGSISSYCLYPYIRENCKKVNTMKNAVYTMTTHKSLLSVIKSSIVIICKLIWLTLLQKVNNSVIKLDKNKYLVQFCIKGKWYKEIIHAKSGPSSIVQIIDEDENDVTDEVEPYWNWLSCSNSDIDIKYLQYNSLTFNMDDGDSKILTKDDKLASLQS
tara:strand:+ start:2137 stop:2634 length:498 start_codon:yes stop_codon:yes gene_type:complete